MGTINYGTSEYITIGYKPLDRFDLEKDPEFMDYMLDEAREVDMDLDEYINEWIYNRQDDFYYNIQFLLEKYDFYYFSVKVESGYYEGFSVQISRETPCYMELWEKDAAYGEIKELEKFLTECVKDFGLVECYPGWGTSYEDKDKSVQDIVVAMAKAREDILAVPIWKDNEAE